MMLRSAEADPHVIEHTQLPRRRSVAWLLALNLRSRRQHRGADLGRGRSSHRRGWPPRQSSRALGAARRRSAGLPHGRGRETPRGWLRPPKRERAGLVERITERPTSRLCSTDESVVSHPPLPAERHSFLPWALFPFKAPPRLASIRPCLAGGWTVSAEPRFDLRGTRAWRLSAANRVEASCNRDPFAGCPPLPRRGAAPGRRRGAEAESDRRAFSARPRDPRWRVLWPPLDRSRGRV
jgi:hypothetical protein